MRILPASNAPDAWSTVTNGSGPPDPTSLGRWVAIERGGPVGGVEVRVRPDRRPFLSVHGSNDVAHRSLIETARTSLDRPLYAVCRDDRPPDRNLLMGLGFETLLTEDLFRVDFESARRAVARAWVPSGHSIVSAAAVEAGRLFDLDNRLRRLVPGTEGWIGDRAMFDRELSESPPFDPSAYLVGVDDRSGGLVGLVRFWRNLSGPRLGMVGVLASCRSTTLGPALLAHGLKAAAQWGSTHFWTETARSNRHVHGRLIALGAEVNGSLEILRG